MAELQQSGAPTCETLEWTFNPWRDRRGWRHPAVALTLTLAVAALAGYAFSPPPHWPSALPWGAVALALLLGMTASLYVPARYRLDSRGVTVTFLGVASSRPWAHYRNYYVHDTGVHLTTMPTPSALDPFRGHLLLYAGNRDAVLAVLGEHISRPNADATSSV